jgi:cytochrome c oxidase subunit 2
LVVLGLMVFVMLRFNAKANPEPSKTTHNTLVEVVWTVVPILILVIIAIPSFRLLYYQRVLPEADMTIKATGYQWYWGYEYPDHGGFAFDSLMLNDDERGDQPRLLATDTAMVVPVNTTVRVVVTGADVLHSWAMPAFGVKMDAVPGRLNETWFRAVKTGTYYGQCSELCGIRHAFMPIRVEVVEPDAFASWVSEAQAEYAQLETSKDMLADAGNLNK